MSLPSTGPSGRRRWVLRGLAVLCLAVFAASVVIGVLMWGKVRDQNSLNADRSDALATAEQFALRMDNFAAPSVASYEANIEKLLTTKGKTDFAQVKGLIGQVYTTAQPAKGGQAPTGSIALAGVTDATTDSATVLVAHDSSLPGTTKALHFRWTVSLRKVSGKWLVDGLPPEVAGTS